jgi:cyclophilin family peptidyl-prolyl cis-trans isomerase
MDAEKVIQMPFLAARNVTFSGFMCILPVPMFRSLFVVCAGLFLLLGSNAAQGQTYVRFNTNLGNIDVMLYSSTEPNTVNNFMQYVTTGAYSNSFFHRSIQETSAQSPPDGFHIVQGGGYVISGNSINAITSLGNINDEFNSANLNVAGTIAMAREADGSGNVIPNSANSEWYFNNADNPSLDAQGYTVFGIVANPYSLAVLNSIAAVPVPIPNSLDIDSSYPDGDPSSVFYDLPLLNYNSSSGVQVSNIVFVNSVSTVTLTDFPTWQSAKFTQQQIQTGTTVTGATAVPFHDGVPNLYKYLFDIDPSQPMTDAERSALPVLGSTTSNGTTFLTLTYRQSSTATGLAIVAQTSSDLVNWTTVPNANPIQVNTDTTTTPNDPIMLIAIPASGPRQFVRLSITQSN